MRWHTHALYAVFLFSFSLCDLVIAQNEPEDSAVAWTMFACMMFGAGIIATLAAIKTYAYPNYFDDDDDDDQDDGEPVAHQAGARP